MTKIYLAGNVSAVNMILKFEYNAKYEKESERWYCLTKKDAAKAQKFIDNYVLTDEELQERQKYQEQKSALKNKIAQLKYQEQLNDIEKPEPSEMRFIDNCIIAVKGDQIALADDVKRYRALYTKYQAYFELKNLPDDIRNKSCRRQIKSNY